MGTRKIGRTKRSQRRQRTRISKKKTIQHIVQPKSEVQQVVSQITCGRGVETCSRRKNELTQCPRHADVFTYPRRPSVHTGHPAGTHTSADKRFLVMRCVCAKNKTYVTSYTCQHLCFWTLYTSLPNSLQECRLPRKDRHTCHHGRHEWIMYVGGSTHCCTDMTWQTRVMTRICAVHDPHLLEIASPMPPSHDGRSCRTTDVSKAYAACIDHQHPNT